MTTVHSSFRPFWLGCCLLLMPQEAIAFHALHRAGSFPDSQGGPQGWPGGCFSSSIALGTAPCQGSSGPLRLRSCLLPSHLQGASRALALSGSLAHCKFGVGLSSALPLAPFPMGFLHPSRAAFSSSACLQHKHGTDTRVLFMHPWPGSTAMKQILEGKKCVCN